MAKTNKPVFLFKYCKEAHGSLLLSFKDEAGNAVSIVGWELEAHIRTNGRKPVTSNNGFKQELGPLTDEYAATGCTYVTFTEEQEKCLDAGNYFIDIYRKLEDRKLLLITGRIILTESILGTD